ncbi:hypothetical protein [Streptomyces sp. CRN 30]|uniref:hypothetical protein n=1 Tax=Streptomyces sp. CRN 30 TaxID=3075613 RepID=UPI002A833C20|nr:hypothetical protein [Streptomyces sp. CRN 30]
MRSARRLAAAATVTAVLALPYGAAAHARVDDGDGDAPSARYPGAECRVRTTGSRVTAHCHNPYPRTDRVSLHVECARWWDLDSDGTPVAARPAETVRLTGHCWKEVGSAWVSHRHPD